MLQGPVGSDSQSPSYPWRAGQTSIHGFRENRGGLKGAKSTASPSPHNTTQIPPPFKPRPGIDPGKEKSPLAPEHLDLSSAPPKPTERERDLNAAIPARPFPDKSSTGLPTPEEMSTSVPEQARQVAPGSTGLPTPTCTVYMVSWRQVCQFPASVRQTRLTMSLATPV